MAPLINLGTTRKWSAPRPGRFNLTSSASAAGTCGLGGLLGSRAGLDVLKRRKISTVARLCPAGEQTVVTQHLDRNIHELTDKKANWVGEVHCILTPSLKVSSACSGHHCSYCLHDACAKTNVPSSHPPNRFDIILLKAVL